MRSDLIGIDPAQLWELYYQLNLFAGICKNPHIEPIKNPVTGEEHRARISLPNGFEYKEAEMGNTVHCRVDAGDKFTFELKNTYAQLNAFDWSN
jgi:hypothetical protein